MGGMRRGPKASTQIQLEGMEEHKRRVGSEAAPASGIVFVGLSAHWPDRKPRGDFKGRYSSNSEPAELSRNPSSTKLPVSWPKLSVCARRGCRGLQGITVSPRDGDAGLAPKRGSGFITDLPLLGSGAPAPPKLLHRFNTELFSAPSRYMLQPLERKTPHHGTAPTPPGFSGCPPTLCTTGTVGAGPGGVSEPSTADPEGFESFIFKQKATTSPILHVLLLGYNLPAQRHLELRQPKIKSAKICQIYYTPPVPQPTSGSE